MPFTLRVLEVIVDDDETAIRGRLETGAYFGPELVLVVSRDGRELKTSICSHGMGCAEDWPVRPEHRETVLILYLPRLPEGFTPVSVVGLGAVEIAPERIDVSSCLDEPEFWAGELSLHCSSEEVEDPGRTFLGVSMKTSNAWFKANVASHQEVGRWPYVRVALRDDRYIELEMAAGTEYQSRIWIGDLADERRVLLGYHSGHFSLPALRIAEVEWLATQDPNSASPLLWLSAAYLSAGEYPRALAERLVANLPGLKKGKTPLVAEMYLANLAIDGLKWKNDSKRGWINNWDYSQRNPKSDMSVLSADDFTYIRGFFP